MREGRRRPSLRAGLGALKLDNPAAMREGRRRPSLAVVRAVIALVQGPQ